MSVTDLSQYKLNALKYELQKEALAALYAITEAPDEMFKEFQELYKDRLDNKEITGDFFKDKKFCIRILAKEQVSIFLPMV